MTVFGLGPYLQAIFIGVAMQAADYGLKGKIFIYYDFSNTISSPKNANKCRVVLLLQKTHSKRTLSRNVCFFETDARDLHILHNDHMP